MKLQPNVQVRSPAPTMVVDAGLPAGTYRFQLVVVNARGQASAPATVDVVILPQIIRLPGTTPIGPPIIRPPSPL